MPITFPPAVDGVTYKVPSTGVTYVYNSSANCWEPQSSLISETLEDFTQDLVELQTETENQDGRIEALETRPNEGVQLTGSKNTDHYTILVNDDAAKGCVIPLATDFLSGLLGPDDRRHLYTWNAEEYYNKEEIDNQLTLRGVGYKYLMSSFGGSVTIRDGELNTDNRLVGQVTFISLAPVDDNGKPCRKASIGDTIELYSYSTEQYFRYEVTGEADGTYSVISQAEGDDRDIPLALGDAYLVYLYPTHINAANYYTKDQIDSITDEPGIHYGDYAPSGERKDGDLWFDSMRLRLNIWTQGAWVNPDRNDGGDIDDKIEEIEQRLIQLEEN